MRTIPIEHCTGAGSTPASSAVADPTHRYVRVALVGTPTVGKNSLFQRLTGHYATVSTGGSGDGEIGPGAAGRGRSARMSAA